MELYSKYLTKIRNTFIILSMIKRKLDKTQLNKNIFLLGPRKVGKSTFLKSNFVDSLYIDLLDSALYEDFTANSGRFYQYVQYQLKSNSQYKSNPIIIDEVQRIPEILHEVHRLIESEDVNFILCGSSARKLVRGAANMLGGRAGRVEMRGLSIAEIPSLDLLKFLNYGGIPTHYLAEDPQTQMRAYIQNYIQEEIKGEALVRNLKSFNRFLELVGITNTEEVNYSNIARDVGVDSKTIKEYFQILIDTLLGTYLEPFFDKQKRTNILKSPKFYLFDTGVVNYLKGIKLQKEIGIEFGKSFEHMIYNEIVSYKNYQARDFGLSFWRTYEQDEVDFILGDAQVAIEVKGTTKVLHSGLRGLSKFKDAYHPDKSLVVSNESIPRSLNSGIDILPYQEFVKLLWSGEII